MGREEQIEEREVLDSIFPDEITDISETTYRVSIALDVDIRSETDEEPVPPAMNLTVTYPNDYPNEPPLLDITHSNDAPKPPHLFFPEDTPHLLVSLEEAIQDSLGAAMIFTLISTLKESAESLIASRATAEQAEKDKEAAQAEEKENAKFHGEAVTRERFLAWRERFLEEQRLIEEEERARDEEGVRGKKVIREEKKLTGRELWERGLVGKVEDDEGEGEGEADALAGIEKLAVKD